MTGRGDNWKLGALIGSITMAMAGYLLMSLWGGWQEVYSALLRIGATGTLLVLAMSLLNYGLRFVRWQWYLRELDQPVPWRPGLQAYLSGFALTTTPGKAGEMIRALLLRRRGVPVPITFAAFISERLSDLIAVLLLTLFGLAQYPQSRVPVAVALLLLAGALLALSSPRPLRWLVEQGRGEAGRVRRMLAHAGTTLLSARVCHRPRVLPGATLISIMAWGAEALAFFWVLGWLGAEVSLSFAVFVYAVSMLAGAVSFLPGGLGSAEAVMLSLLALAGMSVPDAIAATVFIRLATLWFAVVLGLLALNGHAAASNVDGRMTAT